MSVDFSQTIPTQQQQQQNFISIWPDYVALTPNNGSGRALRGRGACAVVVANAFRLAEDKMFLFHLLKAWIDGSFLETESKDEELMSMARGIIPDDERKNWRVVTNINTLTLPSFTGETLIIDGDIPQRIANPIQSFPSEFSTTHAPHGLLPLSLLPPPHGLTSVPLLPPPPGLWPMIQPPQFFGPAMSLAQRLV